MEIQALFEWLDATSLAQWMRDSQWAVPVWGTIHLMAIAAFCGPVLLTSIRMIRGSHSHGLALSAAARAVRPLFWGGSFATLVSGLVLLSSEALYCFHNPAFRLKMLLFLPAAGLSVALQAYAERDRSSAGPPLWIRGAAAGLLVLWVAVTFSGRFIAFV